MTLSYVQLPYESNNKTSPHKTHSYTHIRLQTTLSNEKKRSASKLIINESINIKFRRGWNNILAKGTILNTRAQDMPYVSLFTIN